MAKARSAIDAAYIQRMQLQKNQEIPYYNVQGQVVATRYETTLAVVFDLKDVEGVLQPDHPTVHGVLNLPDGTTQKETPWTDLEIASALSILYLELSAHGKAEFAGYPGG